jgi:hypothetical protein
MHLASLQHPSNIIAPLLHFHVGREKQRYFLVPLIPRLSLTKQLGGDRRTHVGHSQPHEMQLKSNHMHGPSPLAGFVTQSKDKRAHASRQQKKSARAARPIQHLGMCPDQRCSHDR